MFWSMEMGIAKYNPRRQGDLGEASAIAWLTWQGADVYLPVNTPRDCDLIAVFGGRVERIQVKTSICWRNARWEVTIATRGGNQSWSGLTKQFDPERCERLYVHVGDGRRWFIPTGELGGVIGIKLGGPKYAEYEIESGNPLPSRPSELAVPTLH